VVVYIRPRLGKAWHTSCVFREVAPPALDVATRTANLLVSPRRPSPRPRVGPHARDQYTQVPLPWCPNDRTFSSELIALDDWAAYDVCGDDHADEDSFRASQQSAALDQNTALYTTAADCRFLALLFGLPRTFAYRSLFPYPP